MVFLVKKLKNSNFYKIFFILTIILVFKLAYSEQSLFLHGGYTFETFPGQKSASVYMVIYNNSKDDVIINSITTNVSKVSEFHTHVVERNITRMKKLDKIIIKGNNKLYLQPGKTHIMLMGLNRDLNDYDEFDLILKSKGNKQYKTVIKVLNKKLDQSNQM